MTNPVPEVVFWMLDQLSQWGIQTTQTWTIGADPTCTIRIADDDQVCAFHALAFRTPDGSCWIVDLGQHSAPHGTWVRVHGGLFTRVGVPERLRVGYMLRIGRTELPWRAP